MIGEYAQAIAVGRATALSAAQEMLHTKRGNDNDDDTTAKNTTAQQRRNSPSDWALGAYGSTFVLAPSFSLRLGAEDSLLLRAAIQHEGLAVLLQSELSGRYVVTIRAVARAVLGLALCQATCPALRPSIFVGQDRAHASAPSQPLTTLSVPSHSRSRSRRGRPELTRLYDLGFGAAVAPGLTEHAHRVWTDENAGGSSRNSEAMSMELLRRVQA